MVDGVDSQLLKMQMIQNSDSDRPTHAFYTTKNNSLRKPIFKMYWSYLPLSKH